MQEIFTFTRLETEENFIEYKKQLDAYSVYKFYHENTPKSYPCLVATNPTYSSAEDFNYQDGYEHLFVYKLENTPEEIFAITKFK